MRIDLLSLFPSMFEAVLHRSILGRALERGVCDVRCVDIRDFADGKHRVTDDTPYGGGAGMVMKVEPIVRAIEAVVGDEGGDWEGRTIALMSAAGQRFDQASAGALSATRHLVLIAGRYEGVDERVVDYVDREISIGDFVMTGGELAAMVVVDAVVRLLPGAVGNAESIEQESFRDLRLEYPHYTRPASFAGAAVPAVLLSGDHRRIAEWRTSMSLRRTAQRRPDLLRGAPPSATERELMTGLGEWGGPR